MRELYFILLACLCLSACRGDRVAHDTDLPSLSVTAWGNHIELFMEYRALVVDQETDFAAHITLLPNFKPMKQGRVTVSLALADVGVVTGTAEVASSRGIFRPTVRPTQAGKCTMTVIVESAEVREEIPAGVCEIFASPSAALAAIGNPPEPSGGISFLKEQQWKTDFATLPVQERELQPSLRANGEIVPATGRDVRIVAPVAARVALVSPPPMLGTNVREGQVLAYLAPRGRGEGDPASLEAAVAAARAELEASRAQLARAERLYAEEAVARKAVEEARARFEAAEARSTEALTRLSQYAGGVVGSTAAGRGSLPLVSPVDGTLVTAEAASGEAVEEGKLLFRVVDLGTVWLQARVFEAEIPSVEKANGGWFTIEGDETPISLDEPRARVLTVGHVIDAKSRTVPVIFEVKNDEARLRLGQFVKVSIATGPPVHRLAIPESALVDDAGRPIAYVQIEGELFERRSLTLGVRERGWVEVVSGLSLGERVVSKGAYELRLASASGSVPAHGHAH